MRRRKLVRRDRIDLRVSEFAPDAALARAHARAVEEERRPRPITPDPGITQRW